MHTVVEGDSLWAISDQWNVDVDELAEVNGLSRSSVLRVGHSLILPESSLSGVDLTRLPEDLANSTERLALMGTFDYWAHEYSVPADLLKALAWFESGWNNDKRSSANAIGIGQILPITADFVLGEPHRRDPRPRGPGAEHPDQRPLHALSPRQCRQC